MRQPRVARRSSFAKFLTSAAAGVLLCGAAFAFAGEQTIELSQAPAPVQAAIKKAVGAGKITEVVKETEDGKTVYEADFELADRDHSVTVDEAGKVLEESAEIDVKSLPAPVVEAVKKKFPNAKIEDAEEVKADGKTFYDIEVEVGDVDHDLRVDATGKILSDETSHEEHDQHGAEAKDAKDAPKK
jgi:uncharacterized membrane protein YkoI